MRFLRAGRDTVLLEANICRTLFTVDVISKTDGGENDLLIIVLVKRRPIFLRHFFGNRFVQVHSAFRRDKELTVERCGNPKGSLSHRVGLKVVRQSGVIMLQRTEGICSD